MKDEIDSVVRPRSRGPWVFNLLHIILLVAIALVVVGSMVANDLLARVHVALSPFTTPIAEVLPHVAWIAAQRPDSTEFMHLITTLYVLVGAVFINITFAHFIIVDEDAEVTYKHDVFSYSELLQRYYFGLLRPTVYPNYGPVASHFGSQHFSSPESRAPLSVALADIARQPVVKWEWLFVLVFGFILLPASGVLRDGWALFHANILVVVLVYFQVVGLFGSGFLLFYYIRDNMKVRKQK